MADNVRESKLIVSADNRASGVLRKIGRDLGALGRKSGLSKVAREARMVGTAFTGVARSIGRYRAVFTGAVAGLAGIGLSAAGIVAMGKAYASTIDEQAKFARQTGLSLNQLRKLNFIAGRQGVSQETLNSSLVAMTKRVGEAKNGTGALTAYLKKSNPALLAQIKATTSSSEAFDLLMQAAHNIQDPMEKAAFLAAAFSRSGIEMGRIAELDAEGFRKLGKLGEFLQGVLGKNAGPEAEDFSDALGDVGTAIGSWRDAIAEKLLPIMTPMLKSLSVWIANNRELIATRIGDWFRHFGDWLKTVDWEKFGTDVKDLGSGLLDMVRAMKWAVHAIGGPKNALIALAGLTFAPVIASLGRLALALGRVGIAAAGVSGIGVLPLIGLAGAGFLIWRNWKDVGPLFKDTGKQVNLAIGDIEKAVAALNKGDLKGFNRNVHAPIGRVGTALWDVARAMGAIVENETHVNENILSPLAKQAKDFVKASPALSGALQAAGDAVGRFRKTLFTGADAGVSAWREAFRKMDDSASGFRTNLENLMSWARNFGPRFANAIAGGDTAELKQAGKDIIGNLWTGMKEKFAELLAWAKNIGPSIGRTIGGAIWGKGGDAGAAGGGMSPVPQQSAPGMSPVPVQPGGGMSPVPQKQSYAPGDILRQQRDASNAGLVQALKTALAEGAAKGQVDLAVRFANAPAGTSAHADVKGKGVGRLTLNTGKSMATGLA